MKTHTNQFQNAVFPERKLWHNKLDLIAHDTDFLLNLLVSLQLKHQITTRHDEKVVLFFNYFQHVFHVVKHLKKVLLIMYQDVPDKNVEQNVSDNQCPYCLANFKEEINYLEKEHKTFKFNFEAFVKNVNNQNNNN